MQFTPIIQFILFIKFTRSSLDLSIFNKASCPILWCYCRTLLNSLVFFCEITTGTSTSNGPVHKRLILNALSLSLQFTKCKHPDTARHLYPRHQMHELLGSEHHWSLQRQSLAMSPVNHQSRQDHKHSVSCLSDEFACADGFQCIADLYLCDGWEICEDGSDESESLCTRPCSVDMFACADALKCIPKRGICSG